jgi:hypothetical protein
MSGRISFRRVIWTAPLWLAVAAVALCAASGRAADGDEVLVLRNGNVLQGAVARHGDQYRIDMPEATLRVPVDQVERYCRSLDEAYEQRRASRVGQSADAHLELARWCLRNGMLEHAAREVLDARTIDPGHPSLPGIGEQLGHLLKARTATPAREKTLDANLATAQPAETAPDRPAEMLEVELSEAARAQFARSIQPMLIHSCSTGGCHQPGSQRQLQLDRWALQGAGNAEIVRRNLTSVSALINEDDPPSSPLIQWARQAHGGGSSKPSTPLAPYQAALLMEWLNEAAGFTPAPPEESPPETAPATTAATEYRRPIPPSNIPGVDAALAAEMDAAFEAAGGETAAADAPAEKPYVPRDAFDPEIFNRRFASRAAQAKRQRAANDDESTSKTPQSETKLAPETK